MGSSAAHVVTLAYDASIVHHHGPHHRVGRRPTEAATCQLQAAVHELFIGHSIHIPV